MNLIAVLVCVIATLTLRGIYGLVLKEMEIPSIFLIDTEEVEPIKFDCKYDVEGKPTDVVVKWWKDNKVIYQWIYGHNPEPSWDEVKEFEFSTDPYNQYSGFILENPTKEATGTYKCVVRTFDGVKNDEKVLEKKLQVVHTFNHTLSLYHNRIDNETRVECIVSNVYPEPKLDLVSGDGDTVQIISSKSVEAENGFFNGTIVAVVGDDDDDPDAYICTIILPGAINLTTTAESGSSYFSIQPALWLLFAVMLRIR